MKEFFQSLKGFRWNYVDLLKYCEHLDYLKMKLFFQFYSYFSQLGFTGMKKLHHICWNMIVVAQHNQTLLMNNYPYSILQEHMLT